MMVTNSQQPTTTMTGRCGATVLSGTAGVGGGIGTAPMPILTVCTTTHPGPQIKLGFTGRIGMVGIIR